MFSKDLALGEGDRTLSRNRLEPRLGVSATFPSTISIERFLGGGGNDTSGGRWSDEAVEAYLLLGLTDRAARCRRLSMAEPGEVISRVGDATRGTCFVGRSSSKGELGRSAERSGERAELAQKMSCLGGVRELVDLVEPCDAVSSCCRAMLYFFLVTLISLGTEAREADLATESEKRVAEKKSSFSWIQDWAGFLDGFLERRFFSSTMTSGTWELGTMEVEFPE